MTFELPSNPEAWARALSFLPILLCSVVGFGMTLAKWVQLRLAIRSGARLPSRLGPPIRSRDYARALSVVQRVNSPAAELFRRALTATDRSRPVLTADIEQAG